jgi:uncharacterized protein
MGLFFEKSEYSTSKYLERASERARRRNRNDFLDVDIDAHRYENESYPEVFACIDSPVIRHTVMESHSRRVGSGQQGGSASHEPVTHP